MYLQHFGLAQYPFSLTPNTRYFIKLDSHQQAFNEILKALKLDAGYSKITGEVGTGKTMLCRKVLGALDDHKDRFVTAFIPHPILNEETIMATLAEELDLEFQSDASYADLLKMLTGKILEIAEKSKRLVLFIDETQAMPEETLEALHLLTEVRPKRGKPMHVVMFGQPELDSLLNQPRLDRIRKNTGSAYNLPAMTREDVESYVQHRLVKAGYSGPLIFTEDALDSLFEASKGIPRLVNVLSHKALMVAYGKGDRRIKEEYIAAAAADTESVRAPRGSRRLIP